MRRPQRRPPHHHFPHAYVVFFNLAVAGAGATNVMLVRGVARQRGLTT